MNWNLHRKNTEWEMMQQSKRFCKEMSTRIIRINYAGDGDMEAAAGDEAIAVNDAETALAGDEAATTGIKPLRVEITSISPVNTLIQFGPALLRELLELPFPRLEQLTRWPYLFLWALDNSVRNWAGRQRVLSKVNRKNGWRVRKVTAAICCFARAGEANTHTLAISLKKDVLMIDLESAERPKEGGKAIPLKLTRLRSKRSRYEESAPLHRDRGIRIRDGISGHHNLLHDRNLASTIKNGALSCQAMDAAAKECHDVYKLVELIA
ncbi:unnamed protein product [Arabidopsis arenosa]|uniref:Uncharacterized protein n=1 Tax=Arabidopsis arenosa TaxID=38785 RepID=A0A8S2A640_ARAAE|nr:unnamed protein product [Arabidopsis arenosa]